MKLTTFKLETLKPSRWLKFLPLGTGLLLLALLVASFIFLYRYFYQTIAQVKIVVILRGQVALAQVDMSLYRQVFNAWEAKKKFDPQSTEGLRDPFNPLPEIKTEAEAEQPTLEEANSPPASATP
ncbi:MAG: hypothetical protein HY974_01140 [Candidatus Kerfeldbacteria bacterium]|nr:hypothetical protein [Candidatus Kerfeldbacteria bacterium]